MAEGTETNPVIQNLSEEDVSSAVAVAGHPLHAMAVHFPIALVFGTLGCDLFYWWSADPFWLRAGLWACGVAFVSGVLAAAIGTAELLLVPGIRGRAASWMHAIVAMALIGKHWGNLQRLMAGTEPKIGAGKKGAATPVPSAPAAKPGKSRKGRR